MKIFLLFCLIITITCKSLFEFIICITPQIEPGDFQNISDALSEINKDENKEKNYEPLLRALLHIFPKIKQPLYNCINS